MMFPFSLSTLQPELQQAARLSAVAAVAGLWQGALLAGAAGLALRAIPRISATLRFYLWMAVLALAIALPWLHFAGSEAPSDPTASHSLFQLNIGWSLAIAALWLAISAVRLGRLALEAARLRALWRTAQPVTVAPEVAALLASVPLRRAELCVSDSPLVDRPSVIGFFSPRILIPGWLVEELTAPELYQIALHEVEHLKRGDDWLNLLQKLSLAVFPLNPSLVWIERRLCSERELACDDGVLRVTGAARVYATCLTSLAERSLTRKGAIALALGALGRRSELSRRVYRILNRQPALRPAWATAAGVAMLLALGTGATELARSPQLVSFTTPVETAQVEVVKGLPQLSQPHHAAAFHDVVFRQPQPSLQPLLKPKAPMLKPRPAVLKHAVDAAPQQSQHNTVALDVRSAAPEGDQVYGPQGQWIVITSFSADQRTGRFERTVEIQTLAQPRRAFGQPTGGIAQASEYEGPQFAAVPTGMGWLIVQL